MDIKQLNEKSKQYKEITLDNQQNNKETEGKSFLFEITYYFLYKEPYLWIVINSKYE